MNEKIKKSVIFVHYKCNNNCKFCIQQNLRNTNPRTTEEIKIEMLNCKKRGTTYLELIGGEMTIRDDFIELIKFANELNFNTIMIATNGRMFAYEEYARKVIQAGLTSLVFSIHGHNSETHDKLTRVNGSFEQLHKGLKNIKKVSRELGKNVQIGSNTTIVKQNYKYLPQIGKHIKSLGIANSEFIFVDCNEGGAFNNFKEIVPKISEAAPYIKKCLDVVKPNKKQNWDIRYVPLCYFENYLDRISELKEKETFKTEHLTKDEDRRNYDYTAGREEVARKKPKKCKKCKYFNICEGIWWKYYEEYGADELKPIKK